MISSFHENLAFLIPYRPSEKIQEFVCEIKYTSEQPIFTTVEAIYKQSQP